jgi:hypothetical protein
MVSSWLQKDSFIASCILRGQPLIDVIRPKLRLPVEALPFAFPGLNHQLLSLSSFLLMRLVTLLFRSLIAPPVSSAVRRC